MKIDTFVVNLGQSEICELEKLLHCNSVSGSSPTVREYEERLASYFGVGYAVAFSSGTAAIHGGMAALGIGPGDEVVIPATAPVMTGLPILFQNAIPVFCDVVPGRFDLHLEDLERKITPRTKAVICAPMWGYPINADEVAAVCDRWGVPLLEDIAQATGACVKGRKVGIFGAVGCASTHERKLICTGEGGFTITDDERLARRMREFQRYGMAFTTADAWDRQRGGGGTSLGINYKMNAFTAAIGCSQVEKLEAKICKRAENARKIAEGLSGCPGVRAYEVDIQDKANYYALVVEFRSVDGMHAGDVARALKSRGVACDTLEYDYRPLYEYPLFQGKVGYGRTNCPFSCPHNPKTYRTDHCVNAEQFMRTIITLPTHEGLSERELAYICDSFREVYAA